MGSIINDAQKARAYDDKVASEAKEAHYQLGVRDGADEIRKGISQFKDINGMEYIVGDDGIPVPFEQVAESLAFGYNTPRDMGIQLGQSAGQMAMGQADREESPAVFGEVYDEANRRATQNVSQNAQVGRQKAFEEMVNYGYTPEQAGELLSRTLASPDRGLSEYGR